MTINEELIERVDLHIHSDYSDGLLTVEEIFSKAKKAKFKGICITDHDTTEHWSKVIEIGTQRKIPFILGTEFSSLYKGNEVHILGYNFDSSAPLISEILTEYKESYIRWVIDMIINFAAQTGKAVEFNKFDYKGTPDKVRLTKYLLDNGYISIKEDEFFSKLVERTFKQGGSFHTKRKIKRRKPTQIIDAIHEGGGLAILAHPQKNKLSEKDISDFASFGVDGLEVFCNRSGQDEEFYFDLARKFNLLTTGGSDFHSHGMLGAPIPVSIYEKLFKEK